MAGGVDPVYAADGLPARSGCRCASRRPVEAATPAVGAAGAGPARAPARRTGAAGRRVLLVEDEPLVALDIEAELAALGLRGRRPGGQPSPAPSG